MAAAAAEAHRLEGNAALRAGDNERAAACYTAAIACADGAVARANRFCALAKLRRWAEALADADAAVALDPAWYKAALRRAEALAGAALFPQAAAAFADAERLAPAGLEAAQCAELCAEAASLATVLLLANGSEDGGEDAVVAGVPSTAPLRIVAEPRTTPAELAALVRRAAASGRPLVSLELEGAWGLGTRRARCGSRPAPARWCGA